MGLLSVLAGRTQGLLAEASFYALRASKDKLADPELRSPFGAGKQRGGWAKENRPVFNRSWYNPSLQAGMAMQSPFKRDKTELWAMRSGSLFRRNKATLVHAAEGFADEFVGGVHAWLFGEFVDGFDGFGLFVAEGDEAEDGVGLGLLFWIVSAFGGAGGLPGIHDADFVLELEDDALGGFATDAFDAGEGFHIAADDGVLEGGDGHAAEDAEGHLGADAGDAVHEEAEEISLV